MPLMLEKDLRNSEGQRGADVSAAADVNVLGRLDPVRKAEVVQFTKRPIGTALDVRAPIIRLSEADLRGAHLTEANLARGRPEQGRPEGGDLSKVFGRRRTERGRPEGADLSEPTEGPT
jgi:uncharacterized protein YjbI with pentapeptide repeats